MKSCFICFNDNNELIKPYNECKMICNLCSARSKEQRNIAHKLAVLRKKDLKTNNYKQSKIIMTKIALLLDRSCHMFNPPLIKANADTWKEYETALFPETRQPKPQQPKDIKKYNDAKQEYIDSIIKERIKK